MAKVGGGPNPNHQKSHQIKLTYESDWAILPHFISKPTFVNHQLSKIRGIEKGIAS
jgi:hypothetical protein